ncbi:hypothetical protein DKX38_011478 [Salix brachista]|uniref:Uncharacterized protein n=1 Tax=Salix brachista TaxID=2182728 RepID=A0A5N5LZC2_9ROSI|nr:hypothetical protein DKX38_011478 [Salix brachista]
MSSHKLSKIRLEVAKAINYIHIGTIKIMLKATFRTCINSPIKLALLDSRLTHPQDAIFDGIQGNLAYRKLLFVANPQIGVPLNTKNVNAMLCLAHEFKRSDLMEEGDMPFSVTYKIGYSLNIFSVTYKIGYSLSNSHHNMSFKAQEKISIDGIFLQGNWKSL